MQNYGAEGGCRPVCRGSSNGRYAFLFRGSITYVLNIFFSGVIIYIDAENVRLYTRLLRGAYLVHPDFTVGAKLHPRHKCAAHDNIQAVQNPAGLYLPRRIGMPDKEIGK